MMDQALKVNDEPTFLEIGTIYRERYDSFLVDTIRSASAAFFMQEISQ